MQAVAVAFLFAIETAMRAGEICGLEKVRSKASCPSSNDQKRIEARRGAFDKSNYVIEIIARKENPKNLYGLTAGTLGHYFLRPKMPL